jgi:hypothetical protein
MPYDLSASDCGRYINLVITGDITAESAMVHNLEAHALGRELGIRRYFVDATNARNSETVVGNYTFAHEEMKETEGIDLGARVAFLVDPEDHSHDFVEVVMKNAGMHVSLFRDRESALAFLLGD